MIRHTKKDEVVFTMRLLRRVALVSLALICLAQALGCSSDGPVGPANIVVISIDGLRADYLTPDYMPLLHEFAAEECRVFEKARANSTWGKPSHVTMLTGLLQSEHGVEYDDSVMPLELKMIQEKLQKVGYTTAAVVCGQVLDAESGFDRGFDKFYTVGTSPLNLESDDEAFAQRRRKRMASLDKAEHFLMSHPSQPVFLYIQTNAVSDYWYDAFPLESETAVESAKPGEEEAHEEAGSSLWNTFEKATSTARKRLLYAEAVEELDQRLHEFLQLLEYSSLAPNMKVVITSAHGEGLGDRHDDYVSYGHAASPYSDQVNVPLVAWGIGKGRTSRLVGLDDIAGTILTLADLQKEPEKSLFQHRGSTVSEYISKTGKRKSRAVAFIYSDRKFLVSTDNELHLYADPHDATDLIRAQYAETVGEYISEELEDQLGALGYVQR
jgi:arylsulfatase A-like enzyme